MKMFELAAISPSKQAAQVFESYFGDTINIDVMSPRQAKFMLAKVSKLANEHRATPAFHHSEKNPTYLKLMMMERVLRDRVKEEGGATVGMGTQVGSNFNQQIDAATGPQSNPVVAAGDAVNQAAMQQQQQAALQQQKNIQSQTADQSAQMQAATAGSMTQPTGQPMLPGQTPIKEINMAMAKVKNGLPLSVKEQKLIAKRALTTESRIERRQLYNILRESEIQQAQVVLAAQAMVDDIQKMLEEVSSMQFKDLPALVDEMKNQIGVDQAMQFNQDAVSALGTLMQSMQSAKQQMDQALGIVTGQATPPSLPGQEPDSDVDMDMDTTPDLGAEEEEEMPPEPDTTGMGRAKR